VIYKVSYVIVDNSHPGAIVNLDAAPRVGDRAELGDEAFEVVEVTDLIPPRGDFAYLHVTCRPLRGKPAVEEEWGMTTAYHPEHIHATAYVAPNVTVVGDVHIGPEASVWFGCVLRGENAPIIIGPRTNVQDLTVIHADAGAPCRLGQDVTIGHRTVLHSATVEDGALVGVGAIVLNGTVVSQGALVGAGALVSEGTVIPPRHLALGVPARVIRKLTDEEVAHARAVAAQYVARARAFLAASKGG
jgi:carbonic anhydrase/acetyltransferase-like protein (isoleucine patch superfamily)